MELKKVFISPDNDTSAAVKRSFESTREIVNQGEVVPVENANAHQSVLERATLLHESKEPVQPQKNRSSASHFDFVRDLKSGKDPSRWDPFGFIPKEKLAQLSEGDQKNIRSAVAEIQDYVESKSLSYLPVFGYLSLRTNNYRELGVESQKEVDKHRSRYIVDGVLKNHSVDVVLSTVVLGTPQHPGAAAAGLGEKCGKDTPGVVLKVPITNKDGAIDKTRVEELLAVILGREFFAESDVSDTPSKDGPVSNSMYRPLVRKIEVGNPSDAELPRWPPT